MVIRVIRRLSVSVAAVALTATIASGCSTFKKNDEAAKVNGKVLTVDDLQAMTNELVTAQQIAAPVAGDVSGVSVRSVLSKWIVSKLLSDALAKAGSPIDAASRTDAETTLKASLTGWANLSPITQALFVDELAGQNALVKSSLIPAGDSKLTYDAGVSESNTLCMRLIALPDQATANAVYKQLQGGADFASLADANNTDSTLGKGGVVSTGTPPSECFLANTVNQTVGDALSKVKIGEAAAPLPFTGQDGTTTQYFIFMERPWDEVSKIATPLVNQILGAQTENRLLQNSKATVDSRYGMWDPTQLSVQPSR
ncbi:MAG: hypothetical protein JWM34_3604 [Ilumatobacteraceae bacterium]|nr:hypothetical protein [Ilumatobacteraceae bacterium]